MPGRDDEFYVGYLDRSPPGIASRTRQGVALIFAVGLALGLLLVSGQNRFDDGVFEFGVETAFDGIIVESPYPLLLVPDTSGEAPGWITYLLVGLGKHGAGALVAGLDGRAVRVTGSAIYNEYERMIEAHAVDLLAGEAGDTLQALSTDTEREIGYATLVGEIVDSKCHLGVMKPGRGKPHKACAIRCISGGVPPVLRVEDRAENVEYFILVSSDGRSVNREVLEMIAEPVEITGRVGRAGDLHILYADQATYRRIDAQMAPRTGGN
jgi:hypothetical protein